MLGFMIKGTIGFGDNLAGLINGGCTITIASADSITIDINSMGPCAARCESHK